MTLPKPRHIWWNGEVTEWQRAIVHVTAETAIRGVNVFEGVMAYKVDGRREHAVIALDEHLRRLERSAELLRLPLPYTREQFARGVGDLIRAEPTDDDLYIRPTAYLDSGAYTATATGMTMGAYITAYPRTRGALRSLDLVTTPVTRIDDSAFPVQAKSGAVYSAFRLARIAAAECGGGEPLLLNSRGTVAETAGAAVLAVLPGGVVSPPGADGALESITRGVLAPLLHELGHDLVVRPVTVDDLRGAAEVMLCGTLDEVVSVGTLDGVSIGEPGGARLAPALLDRYRALCTSPQPTAVQTVVSW